MKKSICILGLVALAALFALASWAQAPATKAVAAPDTSAAQKEAPAEVQLKVDTAFSYCALEMTGSYDQHSAAFEKLYTEAAQQGIFGGMPFGIYWNSPADTPVEKLKWELGFALPAGKTPKDPLKLKRWEFTTMATLEYHGAFSGKEMNDAYAKVYRWIADHGYKAAGPVMEAYLNTPSQDEKGVWVGGIEINVPVQKAEAKEAKEKKANPPAHK